MTPTPCIAFRNTSPAAVKLRNVLAGRRESIRAAREEFSDKFATNHGHPELGAVARWEDSHRVLGVEWPSKIPPPVGWCRSPVERWCIVPHRGTVAGDQAVRQLQRLAWPHSPTDLHRIGIPDSLLVTEPAPGKRERRRTVRAAISVDDPEALWVAYDTYQVSTAPGFSHAKLCGWEPRPVEEYLRMAWP